MFAPSISGLHRLLNNCGNYPADHDITFSCKGQLMFFLPQKYKQPAQSNFSFNGVCVQFSEPSDIPWCGPTTKCLTEGWLYLETSEIAVLCSKQAQRHICSVFTCSKKNFIPCLLHANAWLSIVAQIHRLAWSTYALHTMPAELCITQHTLKCKSSPTPI